MNEPRAFGPCFVHSLCDYVYELAMFSPWLTLRWPPPFLTITPLCLCLHLLPPPLTAAAHPYLHPTSCFYWLSSGFFSFLENQAIFQKPEEQETRALQCSQYFIICTSLRTISPFLLLYLLLFSLPYPLLQEIGPFEKPAPTSNPNLFNHICRILMHPFTVDNTLSILQHAPYTSGQKLTQYSPFPRNLAGAHLLVFIATY